MVKIIRGNLDWTQLKGVSRQGNANVGQSFGGGSTTSGHVAVYDGFGNVVDGGTAAVSSGGTTTHTSGALTLDMPLFGAGGADIKVGTKSGSTDEVMSASGSFTNGNLVISDSSHNAVDGPGPPPNTISNVTHKWLNSYSSATGLFTQSQPTAADITGFGSFADDETPTGTLDGVNVTFTIANAPSPAGSLQLYANGILQYRGTDYTLSSTTITFTNAPSANALLRTWYRF